MLATILPLADSNGWDMHGAGWAPMMLGMVLFWGAVILGIVWLVRHGTDHGRAPSGESAVEILDRRLAEGAISLDEYHERRSALAAEGPRAAEGMPSYESERKQP